MSGRHSDQYGCAKLLFTHATQDLSKVLLGASHNHTAGLSATIVSWFAGLSTTIYTVVECMLRSQLAASSALLRFHLAL